MTTATATVLPRRGHAGPTPAAGGMSTVPVAGGYASDGEPAGAVFLWAHTRHDSDFEYSLHRHEGLEILTVIVEGTMSHYDTALDQWAELRAGDAQIMRSGSGISHIERAAAGTRGFQIQFDPGYDTAVQQTPSYTDYPATALTTTALGEATVTDLVGDGGPVDAHTEGLSVRRITVPGGSQAELEIGAGRVTIAYLIDGTATINGTHPAVDDAIALTGADALTIDTTTPTDLLVVSVPATPSYQPRRRDRREQAEHQRPPFLQRDSAPSGHPDLD